MNQLIKLLIILMSFNSLYAQSADTHQHHQLFASHGMVLLHDQQTGFYASHLPLYHQPHNYQIIYRVKITNNEALKQLIKHSMVTLLPNKFDLTKLISKQSFSIETSFYRGHFERGGQKVATEQLTFDKPILIKKLQPQYKDAKAHFYVIPINQDKAIFAHQIQQAPSFDAIGLIPLIALKPLNNRSTIECEKPQKTTIAAIKKQLLSCGLNSIGYLEIQDFKN